MAQKRERDVKYQVQHSSIDRISTLPDETLFLILSFLALEDAAKTSVLSHRWRYLWSFTPTLDFDGTSFLWKVVPALKKRRSFLDLEQPRKIARALEEQRSNYIQWVNSVIASHKAYTVERFRLFFNLNKFHHKNIDEWLRHAAVRKVRTLELEFTNDCSRGGPKFRPHYKFPCELLRDTSVDFKFLEKLCMHFVNVNGEAVEFFLLNCPRLEHILICQSEDLVSLKIIKPFPALKRVEICTCYSLDSIEIRDVGLVYLKYDGLKIKHFVLENAPLLTQLCIEGPLIVHMVDVLSVFSRHFPQLETLRLCNGYGCFSMEDSELFYSTAKRRCLKELVVKFNPRSEVVSQVSWLHLTNFVRAAPYLQRFVVQQKWSCQPGSIFDETKFEKIVGVYPHLKEVEFVGYIGETKEVELVMQLLHGASSLEKIIVNPGLVSENTPIMYQREMMKRVLDSQTKGRAQAKQQLPKIVPPGIILEIL